MPSLPVRHPCRHHRLFLWLSARIEQLRLDFFTGGGG